MKRRKFFFGTIFLISLFMRCFSINSVGSKILKIKEHKQALQVLDDKIKKVFPDLEGSFLEKIDFISERLKKLRAEKIDLENKYSYLRISKLKSLGISVALIVSLGVYIFFVNVYPYLPSKKKDEIAKKELDEKMKKFSQKEKEFSETKNKLEAKCGNLKKENGELKDVIDSLIEKAEENDKKLKALFLI